VETGHFLSNSLAAGDLDRNGSADLLMANTTAIDVVGYATC